MHLAVPRQSRTSPRKNAISMSRLPVCIPSAQRTAVKQRPHQETERCQVATSEPVVLHHGREGGPDGSRPGAAVCFNGLLGSQRWDDTCEAALPASVIWVGNERYAEILLCRRTIS